MFRNDRSRRVKFWLVWCGAIVIALTTFVYLGIYEFASTRENSQLKLAWKEIPGPQGKIFGEILGANGLPRPGLLVGIKTVDGVTVRRSSASGTFDCEIGNLKIDYVEVENIGKITFGLRKLSSSQSLQFQIVLK